MLITPVSVVPIGVMVSDRPVLPVGVHPMHPASMRRVIASDIGTFATWALDTVGTSRLRPQ